MAGIPTPEKIMDIRQKRVKITLKDHGNTNKSPTIFINRNATG